MKNEAGLSKGPLDNLVIDLSSVSWVGTLGEILVS